MAAVNRIEYILDSTNGIASAGETITIDKKNVKIVKEDIDAKVTENPTSEQTEFIEQELNTDETSYEDGSTDGEVTDEMMEEEGQQKQVSAGVASAAGGLAFGALTFAATEGMKLAMNSFTAPVVGSLDVALGAMSIANVALFDTEFSKRQAEFANADADQSTMLDTEEELNQNIEDLETEQTEELNTEANAKAVKGEKVIEEKVEEVETTDEELTDTIEDTSSVAEFLSEGNIIGVMGLQNTTMLIGSAVNSGKMIALALLGANPFTIANSFAGQALCAVATGLFSISATAMAVKSGFELTFGSKGNEMLSKIEETESNKPDVTNIVQENSPENATVVSGESSTSTGGNTATNPSAT